MSHDATKQTSIENELANDCQNLHLLMRREKSGHMLQEQCTRWWHS